jgi:Zn-dependent protease
VESRPEAPREGPIGAGYGAPQPPAAPHPPAPEARADGVPAYYPPGYKPEPTEPPSLWKRLLGGLAAAGILVVKFAAKLKGLLILLPKLKILTTSGSMLVSIGAYSLIWGLPFAVGFVLLLLVHEMGHVIQLRREGVKASAPMFIPFLGAVISAKELGRDATAEARVGLAGPILGSVGALATLGLYWATGNELFKALAFFGFFLNLFNLLPVLPLDGGRAMAALTPWMWFAGYGLLVGATFVFPSPIMLLILLFGGMETWRRWKARKSPEAQEYHRVRPRARILVALVYLGLAAVLAFATNATHLQRDFGDV